jgi:hypothetical protein
MATGTSGNPDGAAAGTAGTGSFGAAPLGIADGDTDTGFPHDAPGASGGAGRTSVSVIGGVVGQFGE